MLFCPVGWYAGRHLIGEEVQQALTRFFSTPETSDLRWARRSPFVIFSLYGPRCHPGILSADAGRGLSVLRAQIVDAGAGDGDEGAGGNSGAGSGGVWLAVMADEGGQPDHRAANGGI